MNLSINRRDDWTFRHGKTKNNRQRCLIYTRVMGYYANLDAMNIGKKSEAISRLSFTEAIALSNKEFINEFK